VSERTRFLLIAAVLVLALAGVSGALAVKLVSDGEDLARETIVFRGDTLTIRPTPKSSALDDLPSALRERIQALPERLRDQVLRAVEEGRLARNALEDLLRQYESRNTSVRVGQVLLATDTKLTLEVLSTGEHADLVIDDRTVLRRNADVIKSSDLKRDELVLVLSMDGGKTAFSVTAFGVSPF